MQKFIDSFNSWSLLDVQDLLSAGYNAYDIILSFETQVLRGLNYASVWGVTSLETVTVLRRAVVFS